MKFSKKILALGLAACMTMPFLAGCSKSDNAGTSDDGSTAGGDSSSTIVLGGIGPLTGGAAVYGNAVRNGAQLAVDEINAAGGVGTAGIRFELNFQDDEHNEEKSVNAYNALKDKDVKVIVGCVTSAPCIAVAAETAKDNMFQKIGRAHV